MSQCHQLQRLTPLEEAETRRLDPIQQVPSGEFLRPVPRLLDHSGRLQQPLLALDRLAHLLPLLLLQLLDRSGGLLVLELPGLLQQRVRFPTMLLVPPVRLSRLESRKR